MCFDALSLLCQDHLTEDISKLFPVGQMMENNNAGVLRCWSTLSKSHDHFCSEYAKMNLQ